MEEKNKGIQFTIAQAMTAMSCRILRGNEGVRFSRVSIDSRKVEPGEAFFAIVGERFDGYDFWQQAAERGARMVVLSQEPAAADLARVAGETTVVLVDDTKRALGDLGRAWRKEVAPKVVAITGSMGKTTTKELAFHILQRAGTCHVNQGNFNNDIGLPLTMLRMPRQTAVLVTEMGMNAPGEISYLASLALPDVGAVTNVAPVHLEGLGSLEAIAAAKGELLEALPHDGWAVVPSAEPLLRSFVQRFAKDKVLRFGKGPGDQVRIESAKGQGEKGSLVRMNLLGERIEFQLPLVGVHNVRNAAAAAALGVACDVAPQEIAEALAQPTSLAHRSVVKDVGSWRVLDDCYNASPRSMEAALKTLVELAGSRPAIAVLGQMLELGAKSEEYHRQLGNKAATLPLAALVTVGPQATLIAEGARKAGMAQETVHAVADAKAAVDLVRGYPDGGWLLVKGSRGARMEQVLEQLIEREKGKKNWVAGDDPASS